MASPLLPWLPVRTPRLILREFSERDLDDVHLYAADPEVSRYMPWGPNTPDDTLAFLERALAARNGWLRVDLGLAIAHQGVVIGSIGLHLRDADNRTAEIGYCLRRDFWRRGLVSEAARALIDAAFGPLGLHRVFATCDARNTGSWRVMETLGLRREGLLRQDRRVKGEWRDTLVYAVLAQEWTRGR